MEWKEGGGLGVRAKSVVLFSVRTCAGNGSLTYGVDDTRVPLQLNKSRCRSWCHRPNQHGSYTNTIHSRATESESSVSSGDTCRRPNDVVLADW